MSDLATAIHRSTEFRLHPLGFFYLQDSFSSSSNRRIHVWLQKGPDSRENDRHQHSFNISSTVLIGCMRSEVFRFRESSSGIEREFAVTYQEGRSILSPTGRIGTLELLSAFETTAGASYFLKAGLIHRVTVTERPCVTMLITEERGIPIFSYGSEVHEPPFARRVVDAREAHQIEKLLSTIAAQQLL
jgi:hypothetical protein